MTAQITTLSDKERINQKRLQHKTTQGLICYKIQPTNQSIHFTRWLFLVGFLNDEYSAAILFIYLGEMRWHNE